MSFWQESQKIELSALLPLVIINLGLGKIKTVQFSKTNWSDWTDLMFQFSVPLMGNSVQNFVWVCTTAASIKVLSLSSFFFFFAWEVSLMKHQLRSNKRKQILLSEQTLRNWSELQWRLFCSLRVIYSILNLVKHSLCQRVSRWVPAFPVFGVTCRFAWL